MAVVIFMLCAIVGALLLFMSPKASGFVVKTTQQPQSQSALFYNYDKKLKEGEKKSIGRLWKNIIFPGIYNEYEDTKEPLKTIKIDSGVQKQIEAQEEKERKERAFVSKDLKQGTYNAADFSTLPTYRDTTALKKEKLVPVKKPADFVAPTPKKGGNGGGINAIAGVTGYPRPKKPLILYEYEASADCKKVREACSMLDLTIEFRPCPGGTSGFSDIMNNAAKGRREVPFMIDNNPSMYKPELFGAKDIIYHLFTTYGPGEEAIPGNMKKNSGSGAKGVKVKASARPDNNKMKPIIIYGWEGAKPVTPVRKALNDLGLAHVFINVPQGSGNRALLEKKTKGIFQVPFIVDPNTGVEMFESNEIVKYLDKVYTN